MKKSQTNYAATIANYRSHSKLLLFQKLSEHSALSKWVLFCSVVFEQIEMVALVRLAQSCRAGLRPVVSIIVDHHRAAAMSTEAGSLSIMIVDIHVCTL